MNDRDIINVGGNFCESDYYPELERLRRENELEKKYGLDTKPILGPNLVNKDKSSISLKIEQTEDNNSLFYLSFDIPPYNQHTVILSVDKFRILKELVNKVNID